MGDNLQVRLAKLDLPAPLGSIVLSATSAAKPQRRHELLVGAWEATLQILACSLLANCRAHGRMSDNLRAAAKQLRNPSFGHWAGVIREAAALLGDVESMQGTVEALAAPYKSTPAFAELVKAIRGAPAEIPNAKPVNVNGRNVHAIVDAMVQYRNKWVSGHHVQFKHPQADGYRESKIGVVQEALLAFCETVALTGSDEVVVVTELRKDSSGLVAELSRMHGTVGQPERVILDSAIWDGLVHAQPYLRARDNRFVPLFPLASAKQHGSHWVLGWLAGTSKKSTVQFGGSDEHFEAIADGAMLESLLGEAPPEREEPVPEDEAPEHTDAAANRTPMIVAGAVLVALAGGGWWYANRDQAGSTDQPAGKAAPADAKTAPADGKAQERARVGQDERERKLDVPAPEPARDGMVYVKAGSFHLGTSDPTVPLKACRNIFPGECVPAVYERESIHAGTKEMSAFFLDEREVTNEQLATFLRTADDVVIVPNEGAILGDLEDGRPLAVFKITPEDDSRLREDYVTLVGDRESLAPAPGMADKPATMVTWELASLYCKAQGKALPTEVQWEYAARGPESLEYVWGKDRVECADAAFGRRHISDDEDNKYIECGAEAQAPNAVGTSTLDQAWSGAKDLGVNVSEWVDAVDFECSDVHGSNCHLYKGGNWADPRHFSRPAYRVLAKEFAVMATVGFRCAAPLEPL